MCIGVPMQVIAVEPGFADCLDGKQNKRISTLLVGECVPGEWLLVFLDDAREKISSDRAKEINEVLAMLNQVMQESAEYGAHYEQLFQVDFVLPSSMSANEVTTLTSQSLPEVAS